MNFTPEQYAAIEKLRSIEELDSSFALFDNWDDRYRYLIDLGKRLPPMDEALKTDEHIVRGCTSRVWMAPVVEEGGKLYFLADSDAQIVKGLIYLLMSAYQGKTLEDVAALNIEHIFEELGLHSHLSPSRRNGFFAMVQKIRDMA